MFHKALAPLSMQNNTSLPCRNVVKIHQHCCCDLESAQGDTGLSSAEGFLDVVRVQLLPVTFTPPKQQVVWLGLYEAMLLGAKISLSTS